MLKALLIPFLERRPSQFPASGLRREAAACLAHRAPATAAGLQRAAAGRGPGADGAAVAASPIVLVARPPRGGAVVVWGAASGAGRGGSGVSVDSGAASRGGCSSGAVMLTGEIDFEHGKSQSTGTGTWPAGRSQIAVYFFTCSSKV